MSALASGAASLRRARLLAQQLVRPQYAEAADLVEWMGAVQCQDYAGGLWAIGQRLRSAAETDVERAIERRTIVRSWPMRGTLHFVPAADLRWMLRRLTGRVLTRSAGRRRQLEIDEATLRRSRSALQKALDGGRRLTRSQAYAVLARAGVPPDGQRGIHLLGHLAQEGVLCLGPREEKQPTFVLLEEWLPSSREPSREEALATLATRYFRSHGPASVTDFAWWTGLPLKGAREALQLAGVDAAASPGRAGGAGVRRAPQARLLPPWDEYLVAYRDRSAAVGGRESSPLGLLGSPLVVIDGVARGKWGRSLSATRVWVRLEPWAPLPAAERQAVRAEAARYAAFLGRELELA